MQYTSNLNLKKPDYTDVADIAVINANMDAIDEKCDDLGNKTNSANIAALEAMNLARLVNEKTENNVVVKDITVMNSAAYPFNNSGDDPNGTVALSRIEERHNTNYTVLTEILNVYQVTGHQAINNAGLEGNIIISDKMVNGFKCAFTGSAQAVQIRLYIAGGM